MQSCAVSRKADSGSTSTVTGAGDASRSGAGSPHGRQDLAKIAETLRIFLNEAQVRNSMHRNNDLSGVSNAI